MGNIMNPKVEASGLTDVIALGLAKSTTERLLTPMIGNGSIKSGVIKTIGGALIGGKGGKIGKAVSGGLIVDGIEDVVSSVLGGSTGGSNVSESW